MSKSELEKWADDFFEPGDENEAAIAELELSVVPHVARHLLEHLADCVKVAIKIPTLRDNPLEAKAYNDGYNQGCKDMLENLKSYCGREG